MLEHTDDEQGQEQPQKDAYAPPSMKRPFAIMKVPQVPVQLPAGCPKAIASVHSGARREVEAGEAVENYRA